MFHESIFHVYTNVTSNVHVFVCCPVFAAEGKQTHVEMSKVRVSQDLFLKRVVAFILHHKLFMYLVGGGMHKVGTLSPDMREVLESNCPPKSLKQLLVVCYTNHALDQFLEGMLQFCPKKGKLFCPKKI